MRQALINGKDIQQMIKDIYKYQKYDMHNYLTQVLFPEKTIAQKYPWAYFLPTKAYVLTNYYTLTTDELGYLEQQYDIQTEDINHKLYRVVAGSMTVKADSKGLLTLGNSTHRLISFKGLWLKRNFHSKKGGRCIFVPDEESTLIKYKDNIQSQVWCISIQTQYQSQIKIEVCRHIEYVSQNSRDEDEEDSYYTSDDSVEEEEPIKQPDEAPKNPVKGPDNIPVGVPESERPRPPKLDDKDVLTEPITVEPLIPNPANPYTDSPFGDNPANPVNIPLTPILPVTPIIPLAPPLRPGHEPINPVIIFPGLNDILEESKWGILGGAWGMWAQKNLGQERLKEYTKRLKDWLSLVQSQPFRTLSDINYINAILNNSNKRLEQYQDYIDSSARIATSLAVTAVTAAIITITAGAAAPVLLAAKGAADVGLGAALGALGGATAGGAAYVNLPTINNINQQKSGYLEQQSKFLQHKTGRDDLTSSKFIVEDDDDQLI